MMKIPPEALPHYLSESERKAFAEKTQRGPIDASAALRSTLSQAFHEKPKFGEADEKAAHKPRSPSTSHDHDRRQHERRKKSQPAVLDTRMKQRRWEARQHPSINFEI